MSSIYKNLTEEDLRIEKEALKSFEKKIDEKGLSGGLSQGFKTAILGAFILSLASVIGSADVSSVCLKRDQAAIRSSNFRSTIR